DQAILDPLNKRITDVFFEVQRVLKEKNEIVLDWKSFVSDKTPAILPSQFDRSQSVFQKINGRYYPYVAGLIDSPSKSDFTKYKEQLAKESKFDFQAYGYNIQISDDKLDLLATDIFYKPKAEGGTKARLQNLAYGSPYSQLLVYGNEDLRTKGFFGLKLVIKNFLGNEGVIASAMSRFIRPQSAKDFTIKSLDIDSKDIQVTEVKDRYGRTWVRSLFPLFESGNMLTYCMELPEGAYCLARMLNVYNQHLFTVIEENFRKFVLSHLLLNPYFWSPQSLVEFIGTPNSKKMRMMDGVDLKIVGKTLQGRMQAFPFSFELDNVANIESVRLQTGLYGNSKESKWVGYGMEWIQRGGKKDLLCGLGLEIFKSQSTFILNYLRDRRKQEKLKKIKGEDAKPLPGVWYRPFRGLKDPFQI
ncbi:MAG: hypothetical protein AAF203_02550, partial [Pseudomonadota bacterium]